MSQVKSITLPQSPEQQQALFGHAVGSVVVFERIRETMAVVGKFSWLNPHLTRLWTAMVTFTDREGHLPSEAELRNTAEVLDNDLQMQKRLNTELSSALKATFDHAYPPLEKQLRLWQKAVLVEKEITSMSRLYNQGSVVEACEVIEKLGTRLETLNEGLTNQFLVSGDRVEAEELERERESKKILKYGISFYDDALGGIMQKELVILGAPPGTGKTQLATLIAKTNAEFHKTNNPEPRRVSFFALEAEDHEIERRIKYDLLLKCWRAENRDRTEGYSKFNYKSWRMFQLEDELGRYNKQVNDHIKKWLPELRTFYRTSGDFDLQEMEKSVTKAAKTSDLIILDHLGYVDIEGANENLEYSVIIKKLRDIALHYSIPIVVVCHLRKDWGPKRPLMADLRDFHGSSSIGKVATTGVILGSARGHVLTPTNSKIDVRGCIPTFLRVAKNRFDGQILRTIGLGWYDPRSQNYKRCYGVGEFSNGDTKWTSLGEKDLPLWAKENFMPVSSVVQERT